MSLLTLASMAGKPVLSTMPGCDTVACWCGSMPATKWQQTLSWTLQTLWETTTTDSGLPKALTAWANGRTVACSNSLVRISRNTVTNQTAMALPLDSMLITALSSIRSSFPGSNVDSKRIASLLLAPAEKTIDRTKLPWPTSLISTATNAKCLQETFTSSRPIETLLVGQAWCDWTCKTNYIIPRQ